MLSPHQYLYICCHQYIYLSARFLYVACAYVSTPHIIICLSLCVFMCLVVLTITSHQCLHTSLQTSTILQLSHYILYLHKRTRNIDMGFSRLWNRNFKMKSSHLNWTLMINTREGGALYKMKYHLHLKVSISWDEILLQNKQASLNKTCSIYEYSWHWK